MAPAFLCLALGCIAAQDGPATPAPGPLAVVEALEQATTRAIEQARPSVVAINRIKSDNGETLAVRGQDAARNPMANEPVLILVPQDPLSRDYISFDYGSGVVIGPRGQILTCYHVVEGAQRLVVRAPGLEAFDAEVLAADPRSDLAVIAPVRTIEEEVASQLKPIRIGDAGRLKVGSFLFALGNGFNQAYDGEASASWGILANTARRLMPGREDEFSQGRPTKLYHFPTLLQLDAKLNLGMSGGAVVDLRGELVGLTTGSANAAGFDPRAGYAIPIDLRARRIVETLLQGKEVEYGFLGIRLPRDQSNRVEHVEPGTPASDGGLVTGDEIISVGGIPVTDFDSLILAVNSAPVGRPVDLKIRRAGRDLTCTVTLSKFPIEGKVIATNRPSLWRGIRVDYSSVLSNTVDLLNSMAAGRVGVVEIVDGGPGDLAGLKVGSVVTKLDGKPVKSPDDFRRLAEAAADRPVEIETDRGRFTIRPGGGDAAP